MGSYQIVVFILGTEQYAIDISYAKEIVRIPEFTRMPNMPPFMEGVINLRGKVIPVIDLKKRFGFEQTERTIDNRLLILDLEGMDLGIIVDDVTEVVHIKEEEIEKLNLEVATIGKNSVQGIGKIGERLIILLNVLELKNEIFQFKTERELA